MRKKYNWFAVPTNRKIVVVYLVLIVIIAISAIFSPSFRTLINFKHLLLQVTPLIIVGLSQSLVILSGGIDLSVGAIVGLTNVAAVQVWDKAGDFGAISFVLIPIIIGAIAGGINGSLIGKRNVPPIIVTLATSSIFFGITLLWMPTPGGLAHPGMASVLSDLISFYISIGLVLCVAIFLKYTEFGRKVYIIGNNEETANLIGIKVYRVKTLLYTLAGAIASFAGIYMAARMYSGDPMVGQPYTLDSIAIAVISGISLNGGEGGIIGVIGAAFIFNLLNNVLNMFGISMFYQYIAKGIIVLTAVAMTQESVFLRRSNTNNKTIK